MPSRMKRSYGPKREAVRLRKFERRDAKQAHKPVRFGESQPTVHKTAARDTFVVAEEQGRISRVITKLFPHAPSIFDGEKQ